MLSVELRHEREKYIINPVKLFVNLNFVFNWQANCDYFVILESVLLELTRLQ